jgi:2-dehydro-3-deoxygluconokinase
MVLFDALEDGPPTLGSRFGMRIAGAESNFGIALTRLGVGVRWVSRLGRDPFGDVVLATLRAEGLDVDLVARDGGAPTAAFFKWRAGGRSSVLYLRRGSAASQLGPSDVPEKAFAGIQLVHLTGITMALSESARALVLAVARRARARAATVVFDPNYRPALWPSPEAAGVACREVLPYADWLVCGREEGEALFGVEGPERIISAVAQRGVGCVVRIGERGAVVGSDGGMEVVAPRRLEVVRDEVGAGDGFAAGFSYGLLAGWGPARCAHAGNVIAACALKGTGDWETFPRLDEIRGELDDDGEGVR